MYLIPGTSHIVTWQKQNLLDTSTYYVKAVIRNVRTNTVLDTLTLTDLGSSARFAATWNVPQDETGFGTEISIVKTVYEDSGYTIVSGSYGAWEDRYTILNVLGSRNNTGGSGGAGTIDYGYLEELIKRYIAEGLKGFQPREVDFSEVLGEIGGVKQTLGDRLRSFVKLGKRIDSVEKFDESIQEHIVELRAATKDAVAVLGKVQKLSEGIVAAAEDHKASIKSQGASVVKQIGEAGDDAAAKVGDAIMSRADELVETIREQVEDALAQPIRVEHVEYIERVKTPKKVAVEEDEEREAPKDNVKRAKRLTS